MSLVTTTVINYKQVVNCLWYDNSVGDGDSDSDSIVIRTLCGMAVGCCHFFKMVVIVVLCGGGRVLVVIVMLCGGGRVLVVIVMLCGGGRVLVVIVMWWW